MTRIHSVKDVLSTQKKLTELQQSIKQLQEKEQLLQQEKATHFHTLLSDIGALSIDPNILVGSLLHTIEACHKNAHQIGEWQKAGRQFLEANKNTKRARTSSKTPAASSLQN